MLFLPAAILVALGLSIIDQSATRHFVDTRVLGRVALLTLAAWIAGGWLLEARAGTAAADQAWTCVVHLRPEVERLEDLVFGAIGGTRPADLIAGR